MTRLFLVVLLVTLSCITRAQTRITYTADSIPLSLVFTDLERDYQLFFSYSVNDIQDVFIRIEAFQIAVDSFLTTILTPMHFRFEEIEPKFYALTTAPTASLKLTIEDAETGEPLPFATARMVGATQGFISNLNGQFDMEIPNPRQTVLEFSFVGYQPQLIHVRDLNTAHTRLSMQKEVRELDGVVVREYLNQGITIDDRAAAINIDVQEMEILPGLSERDVLLSAQILAGIGSADESAAGINIRGSASNNSLIYWNNIPVYQAAHYFGNISSFIPSMVGEVEIYKNHVPTPYGGSSAGLLLVNSREGTHDWTGETHLNLTHADVFTSIPFADGDGHISFGGRRSHNDLLATPTFNALSDKLFEGTVTQDVQQGLSDGEFQYNSKLIFGDLNLVVDFELSSKDQLEMSLLYSGSQLNYSSGFEEGEDSEGVIQVHNIDSKGANVNWTSRWAPKWSSKLSTSYADYHMDYGMSNRRSDDEAVLEDRDTRANNIHNWENRLTVTYSPIIGHYLNTGYQFNHIETDLNIDVDLVYEEDFTETSSSAGITQGLFLDYFGKFTNGLQLGAGLRQNVYSTLDDSKMDVQFRVNHEINPKWMLKSSWGIYHQHITTVQELEFIFSNTIEQNWILANEAFDVPVLRNLQGVMGMLYEHKGWLVDLDVYYKDVDAPISRNFGLPVEAESNESILGSERIAGMDLLIKRKWRNYRAWVSYAYQHSEVSIDINEEEELNFPSGISVPHQFQFSQTLRQGAWEFSTGYTFKSGLPYTQASDLQFVVEEDDAYYNIIYDAVNGERLRLYHRLDASVWYKFETSGKPHFRGEVGLSILNLLNIKNLYSRTFFVDELEEDQFVLARRDLQLIGFTPNLSVRLFW